MEEQNNKKKTIPLLLAILAIVIIMLGIVVSKSLRKDPVTPNNNENTNTNINKPDDANLAPPATSKATISIMQEEEGLGEVNVMGEVDEEQESTLKIKTVGTSETEYYDFSQIKQELQKNQQSFGLSDNSSIKIKDENIVMNVLINDKRRTITINFGKLLTSLYTDSDLGGSDDYPFDFFVQNADGDIYYAYLSLSPSVAVNKIIKVK